MTKDQVLGVIRHLLTFGGGLLVTNGVLEDGMVTEVIGAVVTLVGAVWSITSKKKS